MRQSVIDFIKQSKSLEQLSDGDIVKLYSGSATEAFAELEIAKQEFSNILWTTVRDDCEYITKSFNNMFRRWK